MQDSLTLYKLIVLYMLEQVNFPLTRVQVFDFILEKGYASFFTLQQAISEIIDAELISAKSIRNSTQLSITAKGRETLSYFGNRISTPIKKEIKDYFNEHEMEMRDEISVIAEYYKTTSGEYAAHMQIKDQKETLIDLTLSVPTEEGAVEICDNWQKKNQEVYSYLTKQLMQ